MIQTEIFKENGLEKSLVILKRGDTEQFELESGQVKKGVYFGKIQGDFHKVIMGYSDNDSIKSERFYISKEIEFDGDVIKMKNMKGPFFPDKKGYEKLKRFGILDKLEGEE